MAVVAGCGKKTSLKDVLNGGSPMNGSQCLLPFKHHSSGKLDKSGLFILLSFLVREVKTDF